MIALVQTGRACARHSSRWLRCCTSLIGLTALAGAVPAVAQGQAQVGGALAATSDTAGGDDASRPTIEYRLLELDQRLTLQSQEIDELRQLVAAQAQTIAEQSALIERQRLASGAPPTGQEWDRSSAPNLARNEPRARFQYAQVEAPQEPPRQTATTTDESGEIDAAGRPQSDRAVDQLLLDQGGVLLPVGRFQLEPSFDYTSISSDRVNISGFSIFNAIVIGSIRVDDVNRDILTGSMTARYGLARRMQVDARLPFVYRNDTETTGIGTGDALERSINGYGIGDTALTLSWQPWAANGWRPATILRTQVEIPTGKSAFEIERIAPEENSPERILTEAPRGSGFVTVSPGATFVWPMDPVVMFAGANFNYTFERTFDQFGLVEPGHGFELFAGMNMSINERVSMNFSFLDKQRFATRSNDIRIPGSGTHDARLSLGAAVGLTDRASLVLSSAAGLTDESPDFVFSIRLPVQF